MFIEENELHDIKGLLKGKKKPDAILLGLKKYFAKQFDCEMGVASKTKADEFG